MLTEKDYCDYETCVALKELGFPQDYIFARYAKVDKLVDCTYHKKGDLIISEDRFAFTLESESIVAPLLYEAQKFLREEKNIIIEVFVDDDSDTPITYNIYKDGECVCHHHGRYWSVKEWNVALSEGIKEAVKILKKG